MKITHATLLLEGKARMPMKGDTCDMSCQFAFACANMKEGEPCQGFQLLSDGKITRLIRQNLAEYDKEYIQNCVRLIQNGTTPETEEAMVREVYRYIAPPKQPEGFLAMAEKALESHAISRSADFKEILAKNFNREEPNFHAKLLAHQQQPFTGFFKYRDKPEYPQKTNLEIQEEIKNRREQEK